MARVLLDTDLIIWHLRGRQHARQWIDQLAQGAVPACCALSITEIVLGMHPRETLATRAFLGALAIISVDGGIAWGAGELIRDYARRGVSLDFVGAAIAATCLARGLVLATYNVRHYPMPNLQKAVPPL